MFELYKSEIKRLKFWIFIPALAYLLLNAASLYFGEYVDSGLMIGNVHSVFFAIVSVLMGIFQFFVYKKKDKWIYLINRPVSYSALCLSLIAAGATIIIFQFVIIDLFIVITLDSLSGFVIEKRHYFQVFYVFFLSFGFYLTGVYITLSHSKGAFLSITLPILSIISLLLEGPAIFISLITAAWMFLLVLSVFKADINNNQTHLIGKILAIVPYQLGLFILLSFSLSFVIQLKSMMLDSAGIDIPWNEYFADNVYQHVIYLDGNEKIAINLQQAEKPIQQQYLSQLKSIETVSVYPEIRSHYSSSLLPYQQKMYQMNILDSINDIQWVFSIDEMVFLSHDLYGDVTKLGITNENGRDMAFDSVPTVLTHFGQRQVMTTNQIYFYDADFKRLNLRVSIPKDETLLTGVHRIGALMGFLTTKNIYLFDRIKFINSTGLMEPESIVEIPGAHENLSHVEIAEMMDTTLLSFLFGKKLSSGEYTAKQQTIEINASTNEARNLATRPLDQGFSEIYYKMDWVISPFIEWSVDKGLMPLLSSSPIEPQTLGSPIALSSRITGYISIVILLSVLVTFWISKNRTKTAKERWSWIGLSCLTGGIGFLTFLLLTDRNIKINPNKIEKS